METAYPPCPIRTDWKALYKAAVHETDGSIGSQRITEAERAISARARELFYSNGPFEEEEALEDALCTLRALRSAWEHFESATRR